MSISDCETVRQMLIRLLEAYKRESVCLIDEREPERYKQWAEELVALAEQALERHSA